MDQLTKCGPTEIRSVRLSCDGCTYHKSKLMKSGKHPKYIHDCTHPDIPEMYKDSIFKVVGNIGYNDNTPYWCPFVKKL